DEAADEGADHTDDEIGKASVAASTDEPACNRAGADAHDDPGDHPAGVQGQRAVGQSDGEQGGHLLEFNLPRQGAGDTGRLQFNRRSWSPRKGPPQTAASAVISRGSTFGPKCG